ncbi:hypothetical protein ACVI1J_001593 [Bradyrhizobium diazoefficiens]
MNRGQLERSHYLKSFLNLLGCVCCLHGTESEINLAVGRFDAGRDLDHVAIAGRLLSLPSDRGEPRPGTAEGWCFDVC